MTETSYSKLGLKEVFSRASAISGQHWLALVFATFIKELLAIGIAGVSLMLLVERPVIALNAFLLARVSIDLILQPCIIRMVLGLCKDDTLPTIKSLFSGWRLHLSFCATALLFFAGIAFGLVLLVVPGLILMTLAIFWGLIMVEQRIMSPVRLFRMSFDLARRNFWTVFVLILCSAGVCLFPGLNLLAECLLSVWLGIIYLNSKAEAGGASDAEPTVESAVQKKPVLWIPSAVAASLAFSFSLAATFRVFMEARYIAGDSMEPVLACDSRILVDKVSVLKGKGYRRGDIIIFYPPESESGLKKNWDLPHIAGRLVTAPMFPNTPVFVSRVIGLPYEKVELKDGNVYINDKLLPEDEYVPERARYSLTKLSDIGYPDQRPTRYTGKEAPIVVPPGALFVLSDCRNHCEDSHNFGFVKTSDVVGRCMLQLTRRFQAFDRD